MRNRMNPYHRLIVAGLFLALALAVTSFSLHAADSSPGRIVGIVISVSNEGSTIPVITKLPYTSNDAEFILQALTKWSYGERAIDKLIEGGSGSQPTRSNIIKLVPQWLDEAGPQDTVIVYFSGHGVSRDKAGQANYLVPCDVDEKDLTGSSVSVQWLRKELGLCKARSKFLFLDCCHAGGEGPDEIQTESFDGIVKSAVPSIVADDVLDVVTIAGCGAGEKSHYWKEQNISLFSYWLGEALRGAADGNQDHQITADELFKYVYDNVRNTASDLGFRQNPVRIVRSGISGDPVVMKTSRPIKTLDEFLEDVARQIAATLQRKNITSTGTLEFFASSPDGKEMLARSEFGLLSTNCADKLQNLLLAHLPNNYYVVRRQMIESRLREEKVSTSEIFAGKTVEVIGTVKFIDRNSIGSFVVGKIAKTDEGGVVDIKCDLSGLPNMTVLGSYSGRVRLSQAEIAGLGLSMRAPIPGKKFQAVAPAAPDPKPSVAPTMVASVGPGVDPEYRPGLEPPRSSFEKDIILPDTVESASLVPLAPEETRMFRVTFEVRRGNRFHMVPPIRLGNRIYIPLERGDVYRIRILNPLPEQVMVRLLVDGLNTLPEKIVPPVKTKFVAVAEDTEMEYIQSLKESGAIIVQDIKGEFYQVAAPRGLDNARSWKFAPGQESVIPGFFHEVGAGGQYTEFRVTDAPFSVAGRTRFDTQLGLISIGFFKSISVDLGADLSDSDGVKTRRVGTGMGYRYRRSVNVDMTVMPGGILETQQYYYAPRRDIGAPSR